jgi:hypothetical protein
VSEEPARDEGDVTPSAFDLVLLQMIAELRMGLDLDIDGAETIGRARRIVQAQLRVADPGHVLSFSGRRRLLVALAEAGRTIAATAKPDAA